MKTSKKVLSTFLALFMVVTMFSGSAFAAPALAYDFPSGTPSVTTDAGNARANPY